MWNIFRRFVIFMVRMRLGLKKYQWFKFANQINPGEYYFNDTHLMKHIHGNVEESGASLNWLLDPECKIVKME